MYVCTYTHIYTHMYVHVRTQAHMYVCTYTHIYTHMYVHIHTQALALQKNFKKKIKKLCCAQKGETCLHIASSGDNFEMIKYILECGGSEILMVPDKVRMCVCIHAYIYIHIHIHVCVCVSVSETVEAARSCMYVCIYV